MLQQLQRFKNLIGGILWSSSPAEDDLHLYFESSC